MTSSKPTQQQKERSLAQTIQELYNQFVGNSQTQVICHLSSQTLTVVIENSISPTEKLMLESGKKDAVLQWRSKLENMIQSQIRGAVEKELNVSILDVLIDTSINNNRTGLILVFDSIPQAMANPL
jgi:uncharacterized protein YbcI